VAPHVVQQSSASFLAVWLLVSGSIPLAAQGQGKSPVLQGSIQHSEILPPLKLDEITKQISLSREVDLTAPPPPLNPSKAPNLTEPKASLNMPPKQPGAQPPAKPLPQPAVNKARIQGAPPSSTKPVASGQSNLKQFNTKYEKVSMGGGRYAVVPVGQDGQAFKLQAQASAAAARTAAASAAAARAAAAANAGQNGAKLGALAVPQPTEQAKLKAAAQINASASAKRFPVPMWLAGVWQRKQAMETSRTQLPSGKQQRPVGLSVARVTDNFGTVKDKQGHIYQLFDPEHSSGQVDRGNTVDAERVVDYKLQILDDHRVLVVARAWHAQLKKSNHQIVSAYQDEEFNTYTSLGPGFLRTDSSVKVFDVHGKPTLLTKTVSNESRIQGP
jgi:hypothetical protein